MAERLRPGTLALYDGYVRRTLAWINKPLDQITYLDLVAYLENWRQEHEDLRGRPLARGTVENWRKALVSLYDFAVDRAELPGVRHVAYKLPRARADDLERERKAHKPIPPDAFRAIVGAAVRRQDFRWSVAAKFAWQTLARIGELADLRWSDIDFERKLAVIRRPKRGANLEKVLFDDLLDDLRWLKERARAKDDDFVFRPAGMSRRGCREWFTRRLRKYAKAAGYTCHVHPHLIRASAATALSEAGVPRGDIMAQGGWRSESSLRKYLRDDPNARRPRLRGVLEL